MNSLNTILNINFFAARYNEESKPVLICRNITLRKSRIYFVIGKSGIGKSTFLEGLGLMSNTLKDSRNDICYQNNKEQVQLQELWESNKISDFRAQNYAFIFQDNNLMEHFTAGENMSFGLLQSGLTLDQAKAEILPIMDSLKLPHSYFESKINQLSGGERQRMAFIRAITASHSIIFCDEPTGNLDPNLAESLMGFLRDNMFNQDKTAVIVSHDICLAEKYADEILIIKPSQDSKGYLDKSQTLIKENHNWLDNSGNVLENVGDFLKKSIS